MLTIEEIKKASGIFTIPKNIHVNKDVCLDWRLFDALVHPDPKKDYQYDFDILLPKYGVNLQRPYVWEHCQQQEFILSLLQEKPIDSIVVVQHSYDNFKSHVVNYVIDGKQRLLTIQKFAHNEFPVTVGGKEYYFKDFSEDLQRFFESRVNYLTAIVYYTYPESPATEEILITLFNFYNFAGTPQTEEHKNMLKNLLEPKEVNKEFDAYFVEFEKQNPDWKKNLTDSTYHELAEWYDEHLGISNPESCSDKAHEFAKYIWDNIEK